MDPLVLTREMIMSFSLLCLVVVLLVFNLLRVDVVGLLVMTLLPLTALLSGKEAISGLVYFLLMGCRLLPNLEGKEEGGVVSAKLRALYGEDVGQGFECVVPDNCPE